MALALEPQSKRKLKELEATIGEVSKDSEKMFLEAGEKMQCRKFSETVACSNAANRKSI